MVPKNKSGFAVYLTTKKTRAANYNQYPDRSHAHRPVPIPGISTRLPNTLIVINSFSAPLAQPISRPLSLCDRGENTLHESLPVLLIRTP